MRKYGQQDLRTYEEACQDYLTYLVENSWRGRLSNPPPEFPRPQDFLRKDHKDAVQ